MVGPGEVGPLKLTVFKNEEASFGTGRRQFSKRGGNGVNKAQRKWEWRADCRGWTDLLKERWLHEGSRKKVLPENMKERGLNSILDLEVRCCSGVLKWRKARKAAGFRLLFFVRLPPCVSELRARAV